MRYLSALSDVPAARGPAVARGSFLASVQRELSVALVKIQGSFYRGCANLPSGYGCREVGARGS